MNEEQKLQLRLVIVEGLYHTDSFGVPVSDPQGELNAAKAMFNAKYRGVQGAIVKMIRAIAPDEDEAQGVEQ